MRELSPRLAFSLVLQFSILAIIPLFARDFHFVLAITILIVDNVVYYASKARQNIAFILFNFSFFLFICARTAVSVIAPDLEASSPGFELLPETSKQMNGLAIISLVTIRLFYTACAREKFMNTKNARTINASYLYHLRSISHNLTLILIVPYVFVVLERVVFVLANGYDSFYISFYSSLPLIISRIGSLYEPMLFLHLALLPDRQRTRFHLLCYVMLGVLSLGFGQRNGFVLSIIFAILYLALRDLNEKSGDKWISKRAIILAFTLLIPFIAFLSAFSLIRSDQFAGDYDVVSLIQDFFISQGSAVQVIGFTIENYFMFPTDRFYSAGPIISFFTENVVARYIFGLPTYAPQSPELALESSNFSFAFAYIANSAYYERGGGFGSNFIAELWLDFGLLGVIVGSAVYGYLLSAFRRLLVYHGPFVSAFALAAMLNIIYAPRSVFMGFALPVLSLPTIVAYLSAHLMARSAARRAPQANHHVLHRSDTQGGNAG